MPRPVRPIRAPLAAAALALAALAPAAAVAGMPEIDVGDPSVLSQRGQRLKFALPYGSSPGERVSATRFQVISVTAPGGWTAPDPEAFAIAKPARRNYVLLESREPVDAPELTVTVRVAGDIDAMQTWTLVVPPARTAAPAMVAASLRETAAEAPARRVPTRARARAR